MAAKKKTGFKKKLGNFFKNPKGVVLLVFVLAFAGFGTYKLYHSHADKSGASVYSCGLVQNIGLYNTGVPGHYITGDCVRIVQEVLNAEGRLHPNFQWVVLDEDSAYGPKTAYTAAAFQNNWGSVDPTFAERGGVIGPQTWDRLYRSCQVQYDQGFIGFDVCH